MVGRLTLWRSHVSEVDFKFVDDDAIKHHATNVFSGLNITEEDETRIEDRLPVAVLAPLEIYCLDIRLEADV